MSSTSPALPAHDVAGPVSTPRLAGRAIPRQLLRRIPARNTTAGTAPFTDRPVLRGWLHAAFAPVAVLSSAVLLPRASTPMQVWAVAVFVAVSAALFTTSALYHRRTWSPQALLRMQRIDHGNIPLTVAAGATPLLLAGIPDDDGRLLLGAMWTAALLVAASRWVWPSCPRPLHTAGTVALGWAVAPALPAVAAQGHPVAAALVVVCGLLCTAGGLVYATRWPEPSPRWFGHHEVFHALTVAAWPLHAGAVWLLLG
ncbi:hemolysin III [Quadrisphaera granulorum]|uniref:Hemolysin III n=1 Tax=Quadrisphaera granulorum TaxID=317664 RepID=A0A315ZLD5_9ACTN|nr:hemolysin III family protein [Quadrisphaera granulorum]PWJ46316.1 hemolysin III [Quadrisphaera granulorum]SZE99077.1 hemolysin III [Quadrisphaera granulorum]